MNKIAFSCFSVALPPLANRRESHRSNPTHRGATTIRRTLSAIAIVLSLVLAVAAFGVQQGTSFTYQGQLRRSGTAYNGTCDFQFSLWNAASAGTQQGDTQSINGVNVVNGLFTVTLNFAGQFGDQFFGDARWLGTSVQCSGDGGFTPLDPRQPITAAPYALSLRPGTAIQTTTENGAGLTVQNVSPTGNGSIGLVGVGHVGVYALSAYALGKGVQGIAVGADSYGVYGTSSGDDGTGIRGDASNGSGVWGTGYTGVLGESANSNGYGVSGSGFTGVYGHSNGNDGTVGVRGEANGTSSVGVLGEGLGTNTAGVVGLNAPNSQSSAIWGQSRGSGPAIYGQAMSSGLAGRFTGSVSVEGNLFVSGTVFKNGSTFKIDHPLDPANKFLSHSVVESPDMKNIYDGNVTTDASGSATVTLPDYFAALNRDCRYQLTVLGQFAQAIVSREIAGSSFEIHTDKPGVKVSWQVTGVRQDAYAQAHPIVVEESKPAEELGLYLFPAGFGAGKEKQIGYPSRPATAPGAPDPSGAIPGHQPTK